MSKRFEGKTIKLVGFQSIQEMSDSPKNREMYNQTQQEKAERFAIQQEMAPKSQVSTKIVPAKGQKDVE